jgi:hypothetical protein
VWLHRQPKQFEKIGNQMNAMGPGGKPTYRELEQRIQHLEKEVLDYIAKANELNRKRKVTEHSHLRRTISLMQINEELHKEIKAIKQSDTEEPGTHSQGLAERVEALNCVYDDTSFSDAGDFSIDSILQAFVDFIPPAVRHPEMTCARLVLGNHEVKTKNFTATNWKLSRQITIRNQTVGTLEMCCLQENSELLTGQLLIEANRTIDDVAETIARIIEREEAEAEIKLRQDHVSALIKKTKTSNHKS